MFETYVWTMTGQQHSEPSESKVPAYSARERVLEAAIEEFALRGLGGASVRRICARAGANIASVNYYFRSKNGLYAAVFERLFEDYGQPLRRLTEGVTSERAWRKAVRQWLVLALRWLTDDGPPWRWISRLIVQERARPSVMCGYLVEHVFKPVRESFAALVRMGLPRVAKEEHVGLWVNTAMAQLLLYAQREPPWDGMIWPSGISDDQWRQKVVDHIASLMFARLRYRRPSPRSFGENAR